MACERSVRHLYLRKEGELVLSSSDRSEIRVPTHVGRKVECLSVVEELNLWLML